MKPDFAIRKYFTTALLIIGMLFICTQLHAQETSFKSILKMPDDTVKTEMLKSLAESYLRQEKTDSALLCNQKAIDIYIKLNRLDKMVDAYSDRQKIYSLNKNETKAIEALKLSLQKCKAVKYMIGVSNTYRNLAIYYFDQAEYQKALEFAKNGLATGDSIKDPIRYLSILNNMGTCYLNLGNYNEASVYFLRALRNTEIQKDTFRIAAICNNISNLYNRIGDTEKAKEYVFKAITYLSKFDSTRLRNPYTNLGFIYLEYESKYDSALFYYKKAVPLCEITGDNNLLSKTYLNIALVYKRMGTKDSVLYFIEKALKAGYESENHESISDALNLIATDLKEKGIETGNKSYFRKSLDQLQKSLYHAELSDIPSTKQIVYHNLAILYNEMGNYKEAYQFNLKFESIKDSLLNNEIVNNTAKLEAKYQTEKKQIEINLLNAENKINTVKLARRQTLNYSLASIVFLILVSSGLIYRNVQKKRQAEKLVAILEKQNAIENMRSKIASDVHDDMGANLTRLGLSAQQLVSSAAVPEKEKILAEKISQQSKDVITGMREIIWASNPANDNLKSMLAFMRQYIDRFFDGTNIRPVINFPYEVGEITLHPEVRRNLFLILKESLNNAAKYSGTDKIDIEFSNEKENFNLNIKDYGKGMDNSINDNFSNGLRNMQMRAEQIQSFFKLDSAPGKGVQIAVEGKLY